MNEDRELLELAALAAGYDTSHSMNAQRLELDPPVAALLIRTKDRRELLNTAWDPWGFGREAFNLAIRLNFRVECRQDGQAYVWLGDNLLWNEGAMHKDDEQERRAATRRAIVRAAAEIGKQMKEQGK